MVNLIKAFKEEFERPPTENELADLMTMKREQEGWQRIKSTTKRNIYKQEQSKERPKTKKKPITTKDGYPNKMPVIAKRIDRAMKLGIDVSKIAYIENVTSKYVCNLIGEWKLPRYEVK